MDLMMKGEDKKQHMYMEYLDNKVRRAEETKRQVSGKRNLNRYLFFLWMSGPTLFAGTVKGPVPMLPPGGPV